MRRIDTRCDVRIAPGLASSFGGDDDDHGLGPRHQRPQALLPDMHTLTCENAIQDSKSGIS